MSEPATEAPAPQGTMCNDTGRFWVAVDGVGIECDHIKRVPESESGD